jgi:hypothetical protein
MESEEKLVEYLVFKELDLASVRTHLLFIYNLSKDLGAENLFAFRSGCAVVTALVTRGLKCLSSGRSEERSRAQWKSLIQDLLTFCTMHCVAIAQVGSIKGDCKLDGAGCAVIKIMVQAFMPYMSKGQCDELGECFSAQGLDLT